MAKIIKFKLTKDVAGNKIIFRPLEYNKNHMFVNKCVHINFDTKRITNNTTWPFCHINEKHMSICFGDGINPRESSFGGTNEIFRIHDINGGRLNKDYIFLLKPGENIDIMYNRIIEAFAILSNSIKE